MGKPDKISKTQTHSDQNSDNFRQIQTKIPTKSEIKKETNSDKFRPRLRKIQTNADKFRQVKRSMKIEVLTKIRKSEKSVKLFGLSPCGLPTFRPEKRAQRLTFWVRRPPGGVGVFHAKGWWPKSSCPPSKVRLPWVSKRGIWDVPGILPGCPGPLGVFQKFVQKNFVRIFRSLYLVDVSDIFSPAQGGGRGSARRRGGGGVAVF